MNRRQFLITASGAAIQTLYPGLVMASPTPRKAPYRLVFGNDLTNITTCVSPWHKKGEEFRPEMLAASVAEVANSGVDAHFFQPGLGWTPLWQSKVYPPKQHYDWLKAAYGIGPDTFGRSVLEGHDLIQVFVDSCRRYGQAAVISFRLNDGHHKEFVNASPGSKISSGASMGLSEFYCAHPEYRIGPSTSDWGQRVQNWAIPAVRDHKLAFITEICENYDIDGFELDFMRNYSYFRLNETTSDQRAGIMTEFVSTVRKLLDRTSRHGRHRWLSLRIPGYLNVCDALGIDPVAMTAAGAEILNVSASYFTSQQTDLAAIRKMAPEAVLLDEMTHVIWNGPPIGSAPDARQDRRTTPEEFYTTADWAYSAGADGISLFNFVYYREYGEAFRGPFSEPPFDVLPHLRDRHWLSQRPQHYFLSSGWGSPFRHTDFPKKAEPNEPLTISFDLVPISGGWKKGGRLRIQTTTAIPPGQWHASINGRDLQLTTDTSEPYPNPYTQLLGTPDQLRAWDVAPQMVKAGSNDVEIVWLGQGAQRIAFADLALQ